MDKWERRAPQNKTKQTQNKKRTRHAGRFRKHDAAKDGVLGERHGPEVGHEQARVEPAAQGLEAAHGGAHRDELRAARARGARGDELGQQHLERDAAVVVCV